MSDETDASDEPDLAAEAGEPASGADDAEGPPTLAAHLLALQQLDTEADRLRTQLARLDERAVEATRREAVAAWERRLADYERRTEELDVAIDAAERRGKDLDAQKTRLEAQMRTIIAPREAEALTHEISTVDAQRDANETDELEALEEQSEIEDLLVAHRAEERTLREGLAEAERSLGMAVAEIEATLAELDGQRTGVRAEIGDEALATYDRLRGQLGVAIAQLDGKRCTGCHLDLSAAEIDTLRDLAASGRGIADCPQCGRLLVP